MQGTAKEGERRYDGSRIACHLLYVGLPSQLFLTLSSFYFFVFCVYNASHRDWTTRNEMCKHRSLSFVCLFRRVVCQHIKSKIASFSGYGKEGLRIVNMISVSLNGNAIWHLHLPMQHKSYSLVFSVCKVMSSGGDNIYR